MQIFNKKLEYMYLFINIDNRQVFDMLLARYTMLNDVS